MNRDFKSVIDFLLDGERVRSRAWPNKRDYGYFKNNILTLYRDGVEFSWILSEGDLQADDWEIKAMHVEELEND